MADEVETDGDRDRAKARRIVSRIEERREIHRQMHWLPRLVIVTIGFFVLLAGLAMLVLPGPLERSPFDDPAWVVRLPQSVYGVDPADRIVVRALPGSRDAISARLREELRAGVRRAHDLLERRR